MYLDGERKRNQTYIYSCISSVRHWECVSFEEVSIITSYLEKIQVVKSNRERRETSFHVGLIGAIPVVVFINASVVSALVWTIMMIGAPSSGSMSKSVNIQKINQHCLFYYYFFLTLPILKDICFAHTDYSQMIGLGLLILYLSIGVYPRGQC